MCFSSTVSFGTAALLLPVAAATLKRARTPELKVLALLPLLFALQQALEGLLWLYLKDPLSYEPWVGRFSQRGYLFISHILYPVFIPLAVLLQEPLRGLRMLMQLLLAVGLGVAAYNVLYVVGAPVPAQIVQDHIQYPATSLAAGIPYVASVCGPFLVSSPPGLWLLGVLGLISLFISWYLYWATFTSVWCFFAAILSVILYFVVGMLSQSSNSR